METVGRTFEIKGHFFLDDDSKSIYQELKKGDPILFVACPNNPHSETAVKVVFEKTTKNLLGIKKTRSYPLGWIEEGLTANWNQRIFDRLMDEKEVRGNIYLIDSYNKENGSARGQFEFEE